MNTLAKSEPLATLGLPPGDHLVKFHVEEETISFEVAATTPKGVPSSFARKPTDFVQKWGGSARKLDDADDAWLGRINEKHLR